MRKLAVLLLLLSWQHQPSLLLAASHSPPAYLPPLPPSFLPAVGAGPRHTLVQDFRCTLRAPSAGPHFAPPPLSLASGISSLSLSLRPSSPSPLPPKAGGGGPSFTPLPRATLGRTGLTVLEEAPSQTARRKVLDKVIPRVPKKHTDAVKALRVKFLEGRKDELTEEDWVRVLEHMADSARKGRAWATLSKADEVLWLMEEGGLGHLMGLESYRYTIAIAAEDCWRGFGTLDDMIGLCAQARESENVQLDVDAYNSLLEGIAGLAQHNMSSLADGERVMGWCTEDGLVPNEITWAGLLDIIVGEARHGRASLTHTSRVLASMREAKVTNKRNLDKWAEEITKIVRESLPQEDLAKHAGTWAEYRGLMKGKGYNQLQLGSMWRALKAEREGGVW